MRLNPLAIHMNANIGFPNLAWMLNSAAPLNVLRNITNMTVAMADAPAVSSTVAKVQTMSGISRRKTRRARCCHLGWEEKPSGPRKMHVKVMQAPARKAPNIQWLAILTVRNALTTSAGSGMVAPANSSFKMICTGLNQYNLLGGEQ